VLVRQFNNYLDAHISENDRESLVRILNKIMKLTGNFKPGSF
jgi:hypothetical protein